MNANRDTVGLVRPHVDPVDAESIARECYGIEAAARELGSNQDRNFVLEQTTGQKYVLRVDNPIFEDAARDAQHAAIEAYRAAAIEVPAVLPGLNGNLTQRWRGFAVRLSEFAHGSSIVDAGYFAPVVLQDFGRLAADSMLALESLDHPGLDREHMWDMRVAHTQVSLLAPSISNTALQERVIVAATAAAAVFEEVSADLPVQAIHGDVTDDNVMAERGSDARLHPTTLLDLGDLSYGWRVAELAVTMASMLHHDAAEPLRVIETAKACQDRLRENGKPLTRPEVRALWPLIVLRGSLLVASAHRQLEIDEGNDYARERLDAEHAVFEAATLLPLAELTEHTLAVLGFDPAEPELQVEVSEAHDTPFAYLLPDLEGAIALIDAGVESSDLDSGRWLDATVEEQLVEEAFASGNAAVVFASNQFRLTRTTIDDSRLPQTYAVDTEVRLPGNEALDVAAPARASVVDLDPHMQCITLQLQNGWLLELSGVEPEVRQGQHVDRGEVVGRTHPGEHGHQLAFGLSRADAPRLERLRAGHARLVSPDREPGMRRLRPNSTMLIGVETVADRDQSTAEQSRRERIFASAQERYYERPMQIERGWRHHLIDTTGRAYIDMVNNVTGIGHGHPQVAHAVSRQMRLLGTNSRFLYRSLAEYSERLLELFPADSGLDTVLLVNSGSEAVDLALRLAGAATGRSTIVSLREAYHGWTMASDAVTTSAFDNPNALATRPDWVHVADVPNRYRGTYTGKATGERYAADLERDLNMLELENRPVAGFICESVLGNAGGVMLPEGYLKRAYELVRAAGGLTIADEVQVGFGRMGDSFWGFERSGVVPDIVTIAKPMGNGFPIGGVVTSQRIADTLASQGQFFSSAGGNPVSCQAGIAVLDVMRDEKLQENALRVGRVLSDGFTELATKHSLIGPIHGQGLYLGIELVRNRDTLEPAAAEAEAICERLRELGVIVLTTSERSNVLKIKPPLCLSIESANTVLETLDRVLTEGW